MILARFVMLCCPRKAQQTKLIEHICNHVITTQKRVSTSLVGCGGCWLRSCEVLAGALNSALVIDLLREENLPHLLLRMLWVNLVDIWPHAVVCKDPWTLFKAWSF